MSTIDTEKLKACRHADQLYRPVRTFPRPIGRARCHARCDTSILPSCTKRRRYLNAQQSNRLSASCPSLRSLQLISHLLELRTQIMWHYYSGSISSCKNKRAKKPLIAHL